VSTSHPGLLCPKSSDIVFVGASAFKKQRAESGAAAEKEFGGSIDSLYLAALRSGRSGALRQNG